MWAPKVCLKFWAIRLPVVLINMLCVHLLWAGSIFYHQMVGRAIIDTTAGPLAATSPIYPHDLCCSWKITCPTFATNWTLLNCSYYIRFATKAISWWAHNWEGRSHRDDVLLGRALKVLVGFHVYSGLSVPATCRPREYQCFICSGICDMNSTSAYATTASNSESIFHKFLERNFCRGATSWKGDCTKMSIFYLPFPPFIPSLKFSPPLSLMYMVFKSVLLDMLTSEAIFWWFGWFQFILCLQQVSICLYYLWLRNISIPALIVAMRFVFDEACLE